MFVALGTGAIITTAAALGTQPPLPSPAARGEIEQARFAWAAREVHRGVIESRYQAARAQCEALGGLRRDSCFISVHATRGRALLESQAPYERR
jgi:hypothetical protein